MSIVWVSIPNHNVAAVISHAAAALQAASDPAAAAELGDPPDPLALLDPYLAEQVAVMHREWDVNPWAISAPADSVFGWLFGVGQRAVRKLTWWYAMPQYRQISEFHGATVRVTDTLLTHLLDLKARLNMLASAPSAAHLQAVEAQLDDALRRIKALEDELQARQ